MIEYIPIIVITYIVLSYIVAIPIIRNYFDFSHADQSDKNSVKYTIDTGFIGLMYCWFPIILLLMTIGYLLSSIGSLIIYNRCSEKPHFSDKNNY